MTEPEERDPWLSAALRHAPDVDAAPPAALSDAILREAEAKARGGAPASTRDEPMPRRPWPAVWAWLGRGPVAAGLASVIAATLAGMLWWDRPLDDALPERAAAPAAAPAPIATRPSASTPVPEQAPVPIPAPKERSTSSSTAPPAVRRDGAPKASPPATSALRKERAREPSIAQEASPSRAAEAEAAKPSPAAPEAKREPAAPAATPAPGAAPATQGTLSAPRPAPSVADVSRQRNDAAGGARPSLAASSRASLTALRTALDADPAPWSAQRVGAEPRPYDAALRVWLAQLDLIAGLRWQVADAPSADAKRVLGELRLSREGRLVHRLRIDDDGTLWWQRMTGGEAGLRAQTEPARAAELAKSLADAAP